MPHPIRSQKGPGQSGSPAPQFIFFPLPTSVPFAARQSPPPAPPALSALPQLDTSQPPPKRPASQGQELLDCRSRQRMRQPLGELREEITRLMEENLALRKENLQLQAKTEEGNRLRQEILGLRRAEIGYKRTMFDLEDDVDNLRDRLWDFEQPRQRSPSPQRGRAGSPGRACDVGREDFAGPRRQPRRPGPNDFGSPRRQPRRPGRDDFASPRHQPARPGRDDFGSPSHQPVRPGPDDFGSPRHQPARPGPDDFGSPRGDSETFRPLASMQDEPMVAASAVLGLGDSAAFTGGLAESRHGV